jgi:cyclohexadienyl dehydratase
MRASLLRRTRRLPWLFLALLTLSVRVSAAPQFVNEAELVDRVIALIDRRLALMPEVAAVKFRQQQPVADPARERVVLEQSVADARALQLDHDAARAFFSVQIQMARAVQEHRFARWQSPAEPPPTARDLVTVLRPELDTLGRELLPAVYLASPALTETPADTLRPRVDRLLRHAGVTPDQLTTLVQALHTLRLTAAPTWTTLQRAGVLRVGTTGDYAPFSDDHGGSLRGLDIELAQALAKEWSLRIVFVRTTWPTLMTDLAKRRFDLAASGISITPERRRLADFSAAYLFDGKTPIARREAAARFSSLEKIDQPGVRVIVNPGGTNERFARENLQRATITLHPDNRTIFQEIVAGRADVMITDGIEVRLQSRRLPALAARCPSPSRAPAKRSCCPPARTSPRASTPGSPRKSPAAKSPTAWSKP